ncbi:hypothetical protein [Streptomyces abyssomicinicus]|uniref:hypothetical protein n=1 Tax=Streptomyces abyssomicinicus TaxID=574929 RepID=UPI00125016C4|nr:hypothetical protein [Streptomyces abyssomicinicus]
MELQEPDANGLAVRTRIGQAVLLHHGGDREEARGRFLGLWEEIGADGDAFHRCALAHYLADTQDDPADELAWDLRALSAAEELMESVRSLYPSLHLNIAADYAKLGCPEAARSHLGRARSAAEGLPYDGHGTRVREAIRSLEAGLEP